jgi:hypothetical protein
MTPSPALWAFLLAAVWALSSLGAALLCGLAALVAHVCLLAVRGELGDLRERAEAARSGFADPAGRR